VPPFPATPGYWLLHAAEAKLRADELSDSKLKWTMLLIARGYEKLAEHAAQRERINLPMERAEIERSD
jgi:hypothetical protein